MGRLLRTLLRPIRQPQNAGQAVVVLALGFIGLVGFMGIVTDVSILLARYNTLTRAVDSAAISAAGQMRSDRSFAEVGLAARMMLELHGIDSKEVQVDTCASTGTAAPDPVLCSEANRYRKLVRVGAKINSPTVFLKLLGIQDIELSAVSMSETAVLDIVMVMDVSESMLLDTTYEDWARIGLGQVYVPPTWGGVFSRIMNGPPENNVIYQNDLTDEYDDGLQFWGEQLLGGVRTTQRLPQEEVSRRLNYITTTGAPVPNPFSAAAQEPYEVVSFPYPGAANTQSHPRVGCRVRFWPYSTEMPIRQDIRELPGFADHWEGATPSQTTNLNQTIFCGGFVPAYDFYGCCNDPSYGGMIANDGSLTSIPGDTLDLSQQYGDFRFNDLICQPFKQARDATREFLQTVDFDRGDRVAFVTFDRGAFLIDPDGLNGRDAATNGDNCPRDPAPVGGKTQWTHMLASLCRAERVLDQHIGVRAEPNFYAWKEGGGGWYAFANGRKSDGTSLLVDYYHQEESGGYFADRTNPDLTSDPRNDNPYNEYPVANFCPFQNAALRSYYSLYSLWDWEFHQDSANFGQRYLMSLNPGLVRYQTPSPYDAGWGDITVNQSYELWASCRGTNIGAGLREGNNALLDPSTTRRTGTVWVMIMLSDGAAGASDPVRINGRKPDQAAPYFDWGTSSSNWRTAVNSIPPDPPGDISDLPVGFSIPNLIRYGDGGEYGAFGLCPIGTPSARSELTAPEASIEFPFCGDEQPATRHFCRPPGEDPKKVGINCPSETGDRTHGFAPGSYDIDYECSQSFDENLIAGRVYDVDIGNWPNETAATCDPLYDVDDYARDWADYVALSRTGAGDEQLPTIFTIGFGLNFLRQNASGYIDPNEDPSDPAYDPHPAEFNVADFLGEELLRYIADVGDNFAIDTDYQQDLVQDTQLNGRITEDDKNTPPFGARGPCEDQTLDPSGYTGDVAALMGNGYSTKDGGNGRMVRPLPPRQDCGNYYNAPDQGRLQLVFDDIASRMFTRLAP
jgi:hypothetical protein